MTRKLGHYKLLLDDKNTGEENGERAERALLPLRLSANISLQRSVLSMDALYNKIISIYQSHPSAMRDVGRFLCTP